MLHVARAGLCALVAACALAVAPVGASADSLPLQGVYDACSPNQSRDGCASRLERIGGAGFQAVINGWAFNGLTPARIQAYAQAASSAGVEVIWPLSALPFQNADPNGNDLLSWWPALTQGCGCSTNQGLFAHLMSLLKAMP